MLGAPGLMLSLGLRVCLYLRVSGAVEAGWLAGLADGLALPNSSVALSVIVLGLSRWLVTCFFACSGARDTLAPCHLRVSGDLECRSCRYVGCPGADVVAWFAQSVAMCVSPGIFLRLGIHILSLCWVPRG